jgi:predicted branched-subunit amino acid permease
LILKKNPSRLNKALLQHPEFTRGIKDMAGVAPAVLAWGLVTGVAMANSGLGLWGAVLMTLMVFAGSAQLATTPLIVAGAPVWVILATAFCVNLRFVVFSIHLRQYLMHLPLLDRLLTGYVAGDLNYVLFIRAYPQVGGNEAERQSRYAYLMGTCAVNYVCWMVSSLVGIAFAASIPVHWGLAFAGILALLGLACAIVKTPLQAVGAVLAAATAVVFFAIPLRLNIVVAIVCSVAICLALEQLLASVGKHKRGA